MKNKFLPTDIDDGFITEANPQIKPSVNKAKWRIITIIAAALILSSLAIFTAVGIMHKTDAVAEEIATEIYMETQTYAEENEKPFYADDEKKREIDSEPFYWHGCRATESAIFEDSEYLNVQFEFYLQLDYDYKNDKVNGMTAMEVAAKNEEHNTYINKVEMLIKEGEYLKYGEKLCTDGVSSDGMSVERWSREYYDKQIAYYGELLDEYIVDGEFLYNDLRNLYDRLVNAANPNYISIYTLNDWEKDFFLENCGDLCSRLDTLGVEYTKGSRYVSLNATVSELAEYISYCEDENYTGKKLYITYNGNIQPSDKTPDTMED